jgi:hypothetical protein
MLCAALSVCVTPALRAEVPGRTDNSWEIRPEGRKALALGLEWLERNQGDEGNWTSDDLGLVSIGLLAFLADGHTPGHGHYGVAGQKALNFVLRHGKPSGLLNFSGRHRDMYNHGLSTFVLGQAFGMTDDARVGPALDKALKVIIQSQCRDGGWRYESFPDQPNKEYGNDLSLAVMQAKALRSAVDSGFEIPTSVLKQAVRDVREHYQPQDCRREDPEEEQQKHPGRFTYNKGGGNATLAMAAAGVVCMQEFAQYDDWRIAKNIDFIQKAVDEMFDHNDSHTPPFDPYTTYYVAQALYQVGGEPWKHCYPRLRDRIISSQISGTNNPEGDGGWQPSGHVYGKPGMLYQTAVACFVLAIPNRYLPILQEGKIDSLRKELDK